jgi:hypothetical protein
LEQPAQQRACQGATGKLLDDLGARRAALVRGGSGYSNEGSLLEFQQRQQFCLLQLRQTKSVQRLVARQYTRQSPTTTDARWCRPS